MSNKLNKALKAGYEAATPDSPGKSVEEVETSTVSSSPKEEAQTKPAEGSSETPETQQASAPAQPSPKQFQNGLFQNFSLGSSLKQAPSGNIMAGVKPSPIDYVARAATSKNKTYSAQDLMKPKGK